MHIVYEETKRMLRGMLPLALVPRCVRSLRTRHRSVRRKRLLGTAFALLLFYMIGRSTVRQPPFRRHRAFALRGAAM